ncbi:SgcJ/EcaC family oxidoreductase [Streptomyces sp. NPDC127068]|uniref:SgcJ/EcaC family oxidoreductase n=1 Tax=Streptomyces sp. NPDC127068 TaxID=3347127 RepID=UPI003664AE48
MDETDERDVRRLLAEYTELWIQHRMEEWGELFTEESDFITHRGIRWTSRQQNVVGHQDVPEVILAQKENYAQEVVSIRGITPDVALVHTVWTWPGLRLPSADGPEDRRGLVTLVLVKQRTGEWLIRAAHNTRENGLGPGGAAGPVLADRRG